MRGNTDITIDHKIRTPVSHLPTPVLNAVQDALTIPNLEKQEAKKQHLWGWERMSDTLVLYQIEQGDLIMPRGFLVPFVEGLIEFEREFRITDNRTWNAPEPEPRAPCFDLFPWQKPAAEAIINMQQGIYQAPAGSGKTASVLGVIDKLRCKSLIIVNTKDILWQWQKRIEQFLGAISVGQIGDNIFAISDEITIATAQTLHSRFAELESINFFEGFDLVCVDECHHATAYTYSRLIDRFSSKYRIGVSATPDKTGDFALAQSVLGPVIHVTKPKDVTNLTRPEVVRVPTQFYFKFRGNKSRYQRTNYPQMLEAMITNHDRNQLIVEKIMENTENHNLLVTKRLEHIDILESMLAEAGYPHPILRLTGLDKNEVREHVVDYANRNPCIVLSTLADEALDIPRLDRLYLVFPQKNPGLIVQQVGRIERKHPDKTDCRIYDFVDSVGPLLNQWKIRRFEVYETRQYKIRFDN